MKRFLLFTEHHDNKEKSDGYRHYGNFETIQEARKMAVTVTAKKYHILDRNVMEITESDFISSLHSRLDED